MQLGVASSEIDSMIESKANAEAPADAQTPDKGHKRDASQWIPLCRQKLKERERMLTESRLIECCRIINVSIQQFADQNNHFLMVNQVNLQHDRWLNVDRMVRINREMMSHFLSDDVIHKLTTSYYGEIHQSLNQWDGVRRSTKFRNQQSVEMESYFKIAKNWFDQHKIELLSLLFWSPLFNALDQICWSAAAKFFEGQSMERRLQSEYQQYFHLLILNNMIRATVSLSNAGKKLLVPARALVKVMANSKALKLLSQDHSDDGDSEVIRKRTNREVRDCMLSNCESLLALHRQSFEQLLGALHQRSKHPIPSSTPSVSGDRTVGPPAICSELQSATAMNVGPMALEQDTNPIVTALPVFTPSSSLRPSNEPSSSSNEHQIQINGEGLPQGILQQVHRIANGTESTSSSPCSIATINAFCGEQPIPDIHPPSMLSVSDLPMNRGYSQHHSDLIALAAIFKFGGRYSPY